MATTKTIGISEIKDAIANGTTLDGSADVVLSNDAQKIIHGIVQYSGATSKDAKALERQARMDAIDRMSYREAGMVEDPSVREILLKIDRRILAIPNNESGVMDRLFAAINILIANGRISEKNAENLNRATTGILLTVAYKIQENKVNSRKFADHPLMPKIGINRLTLLDAIFLACHRKVLAEKHDVDTLLASVISQQKRHNNADIARYRNNPQVQELIQMYNEKAETEDVMSMYLRESGIDASHAVDADIESVRAEKERIAALKEAKKEWSDHDRSLRKEGKALTTAISKIHKAINALTGTLESLESREEKDADCLEQIEGLKRDLAVQKNELKTANQNLTSNEKAIAAWQEKNPNKAK